MSQIKEEKNKIEPHCTDFKKAPQLYIFELGRRLWRLIRGHILLLSLSGMENIPIKTSRRMPFASF